MVWYFKWVYVKESIVIKKTGKVRVIIKVAETPVTQPPNETLDELLSNLELFLTHDEAPILPHQNLKKKNLKEYESIIHMDFSENYNLKHAEEVQSFYFRGTRKQISLHTEVAYVKEAGKEKTSSISF